MMPEIKNVFCDRDGTIIYDRDYLSDPAGVELLPGAARGLSRMSAWGLRLFLVTNQSGIGRGRFGLDDYLACHGRLLELLAQSDVTLSGSAFCPHAPAADTADDRRGPDSKGCVCRKPAVGMWRELSGKYALEAKESVMIGDKIEDILFGRNAGFAACILVLTGKGAAGAARLGIEPLPPGSRYLALEGGNESPDCVAENLDGAADYLAETFSRGRKMFGGAGS